MSRLPESIWPVMTEPVVDWMVTAPVVSRVVRVRSLTVVMATLPAAARMAAPLPRFRVFALMVMPAAPVSVSRIRLSPRVRVPSTSMLMAPPLVVRLPLSVRSPVVVRVTSPVT